MHVNDQFRIRCTQKRILQRYACINEMTLQIPEAGGLLCPLYVYLRGCKQLVS